MAKFSEAWSAGTGPSAPQIKRTTSNPNGRGAGLISALRRSVGERMDDMSITDELRKWAKEHLSRSSILAIADRIDAEHESMLYSCDREFGEWKHTQDTCYVKLPVDADGEPIHVGDDVADMQHQRDRIEYAEVVCMLLNSDGWAVSNKDPRGEWYDPSLLTHHKQPTVEDVLRDMHAKLDEVTALYVGEAIDSDERDSDEARIFAEYAAKLQLKEDA